ncbi:hypothetical protein OPT61_g4163 [Boeremia exigua]|uniref:Uncharacterized protein n=1 Tax=Boeremia exigua TaxID=749465 RepID=A0ACC2IF69_9PLEO|nr:hypothetical protein OPT61_g4163 [Boeremia exigua]
MGSAMLLCVDSPVRPSRAASQRPRQAFLVAHLKHVIKPGNTGSPDLRPVARKRRLRTRRDAVSGRREQEFKVRATKALVVAVRQLGHPSTDAVG